MHAFRRQFAITRSPDWISEGWQSEPTRKFFVHHTEGINVTRAADLTLIGYAIDPDKPNASNEDLLTSLQEHSSKEIIDSVSSWAGRWVLLVEKDRNLLLHDACGLRQVFYSDKFCASQTTAANELFRLEIDEDARQGFLETTFARTNDEYWWPGDATQYKGVRCLLPNHYLNLDTLATHRYGMRPVTKNGLSGAARLSSNLLRNLMTAAAQRFSLALPMTAGWDSRALLAACIKANVKPFCYTLKWGGRTADHQDLAIPPRLIPDWKHHILDCPSSVDKDFADSYKRSVDPAHDCSIAKGLWDGYPPGRVSLSGHCSEVARCFYRARDTDIDAKYLATITGMDATSFVLKKFDEWLSDARAEAIKNNLHILDLFYWEQRAGRWAANGQAQWDIVHERFTAFNYRPLIFALLSCGEQYRRGSDCKLYRQIIAILAPRLLEVPINPDSRERKPHFVKRVLFKAKAIAFGK